MNCRFTPMPIGKKGKNDIPCDNHGESRHTQNGQEGDARKQEDIFHLVVPPTPVLELQSKKRYLCHQHPAAQHDEQQYDEQSIRMMGQVTAATDDERPPEQSIGRGGQTDELGGLALVNVELRQTEGGESGDEIGYIRQ